MESVLSQKKAPEFEVIIVDQGSTDESLKIIDSFVRANRDKVQLFIKKDNKNEFENVNFGLTEAKGEIIAITHPDCMADEEWLFQLTQSYRDNDIVAVCGRPIMFQDGSLYMDYSAAFADTVLFIGYNSSFRKDFFMKIGGYETKIRGGSDIEILYKIIADNKKYIYNKNARIYHMATYGLKDRILANFKYSIGNANIFLKNIKTLFRFYKCPFILIGSSAYVIFLLLLFLSFILGIFISAKFFYLALLMAAIPLTWIICNVISQKNRVNYKNNILKLIVYSFFVTCLFMLAMSVGSLIGVIVFFRNALTDKHAAHAQIAVL